MKRPLEWLVIGAWSSIVLGAALLVLAIVLLVDWALGNV